MPRPDRLHELALKLDDLLEHMRLMFPILSNALLATEKVRFKGEKMVWFGPAMTNAAREPNIDLNPHDLEEVRRILRKCVPGREVWAYGSRAKWKAKPYSDLDSAMISEQPLPMDIMAELREFFDGSDLTIKVDVVDWATTSAQFREIVRG